jgi:hypothetical protein
MWGHVSMAVTSAFTKWVELASSFHIINVSHTIFCGYKVLSGLTYEICDPGICMK